MGVARSVTEPLRAPVRRIVVHYHQLLEDLIHAAKNEVVARIDSVDDRLDALEATSSSGYQALTDQVAVQTTRIRALERELARLEARVDGLACGATDDPAPASDPPPAGG